VFPPSADRLRTHGAQRIRYGYYATIVAYLGSWVVVARAYRPDTRLLPIAVAAGILGLVALRAAATRLDIVGGGFATDPTSDDGRDPDTRRALAAFGWLAGLVSAGIVVGFVPGILVVVTAFVARYDRPRRAAVVGPTTAAAVYVLFVLLLELPPYDPVVARLLGGGFGG
jgi:hypothetical protein